MTNDQTISTPNDLIVTCKDVKDGEQGFNNCAEDVKDTDLKKVFAEAAQRCGEGARHSSWLEEAKVHMHGKRLVWLAVASIVAAVVVMSAYANPFPNNGDLRVVGNATHTYCYTTGFTTDASVADYAMAVLGNTTDMTELLPIDPLNCGAFRETDVWWWEEDIVTPGVRGTRSCALDLSATICGSSDLTLDYAQLDVGSFDPEDRRKTAVHELGHSIGLGHDDPAAPLSAMMSGQVPDASLQWRTYSAHDITHINAQY